MPIAGARLGHYELLEKLGEGGMGVVFKARDLRLNRFAALKLLPAGAVTDDQRRRLLQEAQSASALNHPNIVTIYEIGEADGREFIAMEFVEGRALDVLSGGKGLPLETAIDYAIQIADALAAAHSAGIVHRDLKPGNVMVSGAGRVKVLDFGLAKLTAAAAAGPASDLTRTAAVHTAEGVIAGTVSYMSPEQAEGKRVDHRSDIFAFGALLCEMLTGRRAFQGDSAVSTLAAILNVDKQPPELPAAPRDLNRILKRCLSKAPEARWQNIADVRIALGDLAQEAPEPAVPAGRSRLPWIAAAVVAAAALGAVALWRGAGGPQEQYSMRRLTTDNAANLSVAISPDGKLIAFSSDRGEDANLDIWVRQTAGGEPVRLTRGLGRCHNPAFAPDGSTLAFRCEGDGGGIYVTSALGGTPRKIADGHYPRFSPDGAGISFVPSATAASGATRSIMIVPTQGGALRELRTRFDVSGAAMWSPDGSELLYVGLDLEHNRAGDNWFLISADGRRDRATGAIPAIRAAGFGFGRPWSWTAAGMLMHIEAQDGSNIYRVDFDTRKGVRGRPVPVTMAPGWNFAPSGAQDGRRIAFISGTTVAANLWQAAIDPATGVSVGEPQRITGGAEFRRAPYPSPDAAWVAYVSGAEARIRELATGREIRFGRASAATSPVISQDGSQVAYFAPEGEKLAIYVAPARGGIPRRACEHCGRPGQFVGEEILFDRAAAANEIGLVDVKTGRIRILLRHAAYRLFTPRVSPDGRLICFTAQVSGRGRHIYVAPFSTGGLIPESQWTAVVKGADLERQPFWSPNGALIYFLSDRDGHRCVWAQRLAGGPTFAVRHFHMARQNLSEFGDPAEIGLSFAGSRMFFAMREIQADVWLAER